MHFVTPDCKQLGSYSVCLLHAHPVQVGMQLLPVCCTFGGVRKEHEDDGGQNWLIWGGVFLPWFILVVCPRPCIPPHTTLCACSEEIAFHRGKMSLLLISVWVAYLIAKQMANPCLK